MGFMIVYSNFLIKVADNCWKRTGCRSPEGILKRSNTNKQGNLLILVW